jgi:hypothetical protein
MKKICLSVVESLVAILMLVGPLASELQAESGVPMTVSVPFAFSVGGHSVAPGTYQFELGPDAYLLSVRNAKNGHEEIFPVRPEHSRGSVEDGRLLFGVSGGGRVLNEVRFPGAGRFAVIQGGRVKVKGSSGNAVSVAQR